MEANRKPPSAASLDRTYSLPAFWDGAAAARAELGDAGGGRLARHVAAALRAGTPLREIPEFLLWERGRT